MIKRFIRLCGISTGLFLAAQVHPTAVRASDLPAIPAVPSDNGTPPPAPQPLEIPFNDKNLLYVGRFDLSGSSASCAWSASSVSIRFHGTAINASLDLDKNRVEVVVDGQPVKVLTVGTTGKQLYSLASGLTDAEHTVTLFKCTEPSVGTVSFFGFQLNQGASLLPAVAAERRIEVIGDSVSTGYGNEAAGNKEHFSPATENAYWTYGAITARAFGADYVCIAWSGKCLSPYNTIPSIYDRTLPKLADSTWNFDHWKPQVVLINLCGNDFAKGAPEEEGWVKAYHDFIDHVRKNYPDAVIYLALGPMMSDAWPPNAKALTLSRHYIQRVAKECNASGDPKIHFLEFDQQDGNKNGFGADWHPSVKTDQIMARKFIAAIQKDMSWQPVAP
jgi:hypothetical protein